MKETEAIAIAEAHLASQWRELGRYVARVAAGPRPEIEVVFHDPSAPDRGNYRVFLTQFGEFLGLVAPDGSCPKYAEPKAVERVRGESATEAASRYLAAHQIDGEGLVADQLDETSLTLVWYELDTDEEVMGGGGPEVFITEPGTVIRVWETQ